VSVLVVSERLASYEILVTLVAGYYAIMFDNDWWKFVCSFVVECSTDTVIRGNTMQLVWLGLSAIQAIDYIVRVSTCVL
jgi:hypothetical protein